MLLIKKIKTPIRDPNKPSRMHVARSFDINKPGSHPNDIKGGVIGGTLIQGTLKEGQDIEIRPGIENKRGGKKMLGSL